MMYQVEVMLTDGTWAPSLFFVNGPRFATRAQAEEGMAQVVANLNSPEHPEFDARTVVRIVDLRRPEIILFLSDARGIYIPRDFARGIVRDNVTGVDDDVWTILEAGPDHEAYWDAWQEVCDCAWVYDRVADVKYSVHHDGDCWLIPQGMEFDESTESFVWPQESEQE